MSRKTIVIIGMTVGSIIGGYVPIFFGSDLLSYKSLLGNTVGGVIGIWITIKMTENY